MKHDLLNTIKGHKVRSDKSTRFQGLDRENHNTSEYNLNIQWSAVLDGGQCKTHLELQQNKYGVRERKQLGQTYPSAVALCPSPWELGTFIQRLGTTSIKDLRQVMGEITNPQELQVALYKAEAYEVQLGGGG